MKKIVLIILTLSMVLLEACSLNEKKPFGAEKIDYDKVEAINKEGPILSTEHIENAPPMAEKVIVEEGPWHINDEEAQLPPMADLDESPEYGDVPIFVPEHQN